MVNMRRLLLIMMLPILTGGCAMLSPSMERDTVYQKLVNDVDELTRDLYVPSHLRMQEARRTGTEFDVMTYFTVLPHLSMDDGYVLDYIYHNDGMGGYPILYTRKTTDPRYTQEQEYEIVYGKISPGEQSFTFLDHIRIDHSEQGYFEFVLLRVMGARFYLWWHAGYFDHVVVCTQDALHDLLPNDVYQEGKNVEHIKVSPRIQQTSTEVMIEVTTFTKWGGAYRERFTISKTFPHTIARQIIEHLFPYDCGIRF